MPGIYRDLVQTLSNQNWIGVVNLKEFIFLAACITFVKLRHLWITFQSPFFVLQERLHYETLSQHLGKLGEDAGKMVHRVIDLTRPEDLDGEHLHCFFFFFFCLIFLPLFCFFQHSSLGLLNLVGIFFKLLASLFLDAYNLGNSEMYADAQKAWEKMEGQRDIKGRRCLSFEKQSHPVQTKLIPVTLNSVGPTYCRRGPTSGGLSSQNTTIEEKESSRKSEHAGIQWIQIFIVLLGKLRWRTPSTAKQCVQCQHFTLLKNLSL